MNNSFLWDMIITFGCLSGVIGIALVICKQRDDSIESQLLTTDELAALPADLKEKLKDRVPVRRRDLRIARFECDQDKLKAAHSEALLSSGNRLNT